MVAMSMADSCPARRSSAPPVGAGAASAEASPVPRSPAPAAPSDVETCAALSSVVPVVVYPSGGFLFAASLAPGPHHTPVRCFSALNLSACCGMHRVVVA